MTPDKLKQGIHGDYYLADKKGPFVEEQYLKRILKQIVDDWDEDAFDEQHRELLKNLRESYICQVFMNVLLNASADILKAITEQSDGY